MKRTNLFRSLLVLMLTLSMFVGTCATSFAGYILTDEEIAYVENLVDETKDEIQGIIDVAKEGTDEEKLAKIDEYINNITDALVFVGYDNADEVAATIRGEVLEIVAFVEAGNMEAVEDNVDEYIGHVKEYFGLSDEVDEIVEDVKDEIKDIVEIVKTEDKEDDKQKAEYYANLIKEALDIDEADEAKLAEVIAEITAFVEEIKNIPAEDVEAAVDAFVAEIKAKLQLEVAKTGHVRYVAEEGDKYVAIGGDTVAGEGLAPRELAYYDVIADKYKNDEENSVTIEAIPVVGEDLYPSNVVGFIKDNAAQFTDAKLITYQLDASRLIWAIVEDEPEWEKYFDAETQAVINEVWAQAEEILATDWAVEGMAAVTDFEEKVKAAVLANLPAGTQITEDHINAVITFCNEYIQRVLNLVETKKEEVEDKKDEVVSQIAALDPMVLDYAEKLAYAVVSYAVESKNAIEAIQEIKPDAALVVVGMYNQLDGFKLAVGEEEIDAGEYFKYAIDATNIYYAALAAINGNFAFVDVSDAEINGFNGDPIPVSSDIVSNIGTLTQPLKNKSMHANAAGHQTIADRILAAFECDYKVYEQLDANNHTVKCAMCEDSYTEAHTFVGNTCEKCGYEKVYTPVYGSVGGGAASQFIVKFDTNGGSKIANVTVKKGETLTKPADPTKEGFDFGGWYTDKALTKAYDFATPVTKSFTLYAKWTEGDVLAKFTDVSKDAWYYEYIKEIVAKGLMNGVSETEFAPEATLTRGMFVTILHRVEGEAAVENAASFTDVADTEYYAAAVKWANANGIVNGVTETEFAPNAEVTREQMAAMLARFVEYKKIEVAAEGDVTYTDSDAISEYAQDAVKTANKLGILIGNADGSFAPKSNATRAEAAALFVRLLGVIEK